MLKKNEIKLSIIIPCYNEINTIKKIIKKVIYNLDQFDFNDYEIIIIDDCSNDGTSEILEQTNFAENIKVFSHKENLGKGAAVQTGIKNITGDILIIQDADLEYDPSDYEKLLRPFFEADADIVYGSRFIGGGKYVRIHFFWHYLANKIITFVCNMFTNLNLTDVETGYKLFKNSCLKNVELKEKSFSFEPEITIKLAKKKFKFFEVPITYNGRSYNEGKKIGLKDAFIAFKAIFIYSIKK
ncbi:glycosyltransferase family 2 protein [Candidatus Pelagibacter sp. HIMB1321]|uniref:glycosyltransferase family 2 protein n=1 Tax=Candidatus Pelagibacter sp. HIMB1321 TaxID=1388755 RepID=UPI000A080829|nr:glycosyltransferase family 2 protein [Candidatus Pelagibacter sp. HIMB1321]SMF79372.1 Glycosyltransferase involved in cell wall bisynthesis [Candidatus Pelagibacter sp. HIMB1321]